MTEPAPSWSRSRRTDETARSLRTSRRPGRSRICGPRSWRCVDLSRRSTPLREPKSFVDGVPSRELLRLSGDVHDALTATEASSFYARLVIDSGRFLDDIDHIATELTDMRAVFEEGGDHEREGPRAPGYEQPVRSVVDWLDGLGLRLRRILTVEQTLMGAVRYHSPVTDSQRAVAESTDSQQLWQDAYIRAKAFPHTEIYRRHADPPGSWRTRWR